MKLQIGSQIEASPYDEDYEMALFSCQDREQRYWFRLSRPMDENEIEVMVLDQVNHKTLGADLTVRLEKSQLLVDLSSELASNLDGHTHYEIQFEVDEAKLFHIKQSLVKIFEGTQSFYCTF